MRLGWFSDLHHGCVGDSGTTTNCSEGIVNRGKYVYHLQYKNLLYILNVRLSDSSQVLRQADQTPGHKKLKYQQINKFIALSLSYV